ncbi:MAG: hypothetical protein IKV94_00205 [Clostridia bacterium]|nr:hypothetical protein [Clostridia bacterium]
MENIERIRRIRLELIKIHNANFENKIALDGTDSFYLTKIFSPRVSDKYDILLEYAYELEGILEACETDLEIKKAINYLETKIISCYKEV